MTASAGTSASPSIHFSSDTNTGIFSPAADTIAFAEGGAEVARFDSAGNFGLGVTPSAWSGSSSAFQNTAGSIWRFGTDNIYFGQNYYFNGTNRIYSTTNNATEYQQGNGSHRWFVAPSGTAGNAITFTEAMRIDSSGNLGIGTSSPGAKLHVVSSTGGSTTGLAVQKSGQNFFQFYADTNNTDGVIACAGAIRFDNGSGTERARIDSSGNVGIGTTSPISIGAGYKSITVNDSTGGGIIFAQSGTQKGSIFNGGNTMFIDVGTAGASLNFRNTAAGTTTTIGADGVYGTTVGGTNRDVFVDNTGLLGYVSSVRKTKTQIQDLTNTSWLYQLNPVSFKYLKKDEDGNYTDEPDGNIQYGMIAEDVEALNPDLCFYDEVNGKKELRGIQYSKLTPVLVKAIQELKAELDTVKAELATLKGN
jgi:hypothetical protein